MAQPDDIPTVTDLLLARADDESDGLLFQQQRWSWAEHVRECADRAAWLRAVRQPEKPFHVGVLLSNEPEFSFLLGAAALAGAVIVGLNPIRRGEALARDVRVTDCQLVITSAESRSLLDGLDLGISDDRVFSVDSTSWSQALRPHRGSPAEAAPATPGDLLTLVFTSGTGGEPKAVRCTHGKIAFPGAMLADRLGLDGDDVAYVSMPMFHSNAIMAGWAVGLAAGAAIALRDSFSARGFLHDVRAFGATYANYVGRPLSYILATETQPDDGDNPLRVVYGNEAPEKDRVRFAERFRCQVVDGFGSTENGVVVQRTPDTPAGSLGRPGEGVAVLNPDTEKPCPPAVFDASGHITNADEAIGELVNTAGPGWFEGYYNAPEADAHRMRGGMYWSGDRAYMDADGFAYFVGRSEEWMRVDGENMGAAPIERVLLRHPGIAQAAVYAVPDPQVGDQVMAAVVADSQTPFDPATLADFLAQQPDFGPKQIPKFLRITERMPRTATFKVLKRELASDRWHCADPVWWRPSAQGNYEFLSTDQARSLDSH